MTVDVTGCGAIGDGVTDNAAAICTGLTQLSGEGGGTLHFPPGIYALSREITGISNLTLEGEGATIVCRVPLRSFFYFAGKSNIRSRGLTFDMACASLPVYADPTLQPANVPLLFDVNCTDVQVEECEFVNLYSAALWFYQVSGPIRVNRNSFKAGVQSQALLSGHVYMTTCAGTIEVEHNDFLNAPVSSPEYGVAGVFLSGTIGSAKVNNNRFDYCGRDNTHGHRVGAVDFYFNSENGEVSGNLMTNLLGQAVRLDAAWPAKVLNNIISLNPNQSGDNTIEITAGLSGGAVGSRKILVAGNTLTANSAVKAGIVVNAVDYGAGLDTIGILNNQMDGFLYPLAVYGPLANVRIAGNTATGPGGFLVQLGDSLTSALGTEADSRFDNLVIDGNTIELSTTDTPAIHVSLPNYTGHAGSIQFLCNRLNALSMSSSVAIQYESSANPGIGRLYSRGNSLSNFQYAHFIRSFKTLAVAGNDYDTITTPVYEDGSGSYTTT